MFTLCILVLQVLFSFTSYLFSLLSFVWSAMDFFWMLLEWPFDFKFDSNLILVKDKKSSSNNLNSGLLLEVHGVVFQCGIATFTCLNTLFHHSNNAARPIIHVLSYRSKQDLSNVASVKCT